MDPPTLETLTPDQWNRLRELDHYVRTDLRFEPRELSYWFLLRFANARNFDVAETKLMLKNYATFHNDVVARQIAAWQPSDPDFDEIRRNICLGFHYCTRTGTPLLIYRMGQCNFKELLKTHTPQRLVDYHIQIGMRFLNVVLPIASAEAQTRKDKVLVILDAKNADFLTFLSGKPNEFMKLFAETGQLYFPSILNKFYIVNAPLLFSAFWAVAKHFLHPSTQERFEISSGVNKEKLHLEVDPLHLPTWLGGARSDDITAHHGPWRKAVEESYRNHSFYLPDETLFSDWFLTKVERKSKDKTAILQDKTSGSIKSPGPVSMQDLEEMEDRIFVRQPKTARMVVAMHRLLVRSTSDLH